MRAIEEYAVIGDGRTTALVSRDGSIDWLCWPRPDSPSLFGAILDPNAGSWSIRPSGSFRATRKYLDRTNVLETRFESASGVAVLTDLMPVASEEEKRSRLIPEHEILRHLRCESGEMEFEVVFDPRADYGERRLKARPAGKLGVRYRVGASTLYLLSSAGNGPLKLRAGEERAFSLTLAREGPATLPPVTEGVRERIDASVEWWRRWVAPCRYDGPQRDAVLRSALVLKLLGYAPSGALLAAPTTSLPERLGGPLNWDYRFCWLRDASMTARALFGLGFLDEAEAYVGWLLHTTRLTRSDLRILYDVYGRRPPRERTLDRLEGHRNSKPVRVGNAAKDQLQLDVYGEVLDAVAHFVESGGRLDGETSKMILQFGDTVCRRWREPDEGIWEPRTGRAPHTHSRLLCWVALDRLLAIEARGQLPGAPVDQFRRERELIAREIETRGWSERLQSYVGTLDTEEIDASVLLMPWYGFKEVGSPRMVGTIARVRTALGAGGDLLLRSEKAVEDGEGAFGIVSFWAVEYLAMGGGYQDEARKAFESLVRKANDVGLFAEQIDPRTGAALGNFPQAFTHVGLINAALSLERRIKGLPPLVRSVAGREVKRQESEAR